MNYSHEGFEAKTGRGAQWGVLPANRQIIAGRTHSRVWCPAETGAAIEHSRARIGVRRSSWDTPAVGAAIMRFRRRAALVDIVCWIVSAALIAGALALALGR